MLSSTLHILSAILAFTSSSTLAQSYTGPEDPRINIEIVLQHPVNGVSTTPDGRLFLVYARLDGSQGPQVVEYFPETKTQRAFPNIAWNTLEAGDDFTKHFLGVNSQRVGPDGNLYIVDKGSIGFGNPVKLPYGPKVVVVDLKTNQVSRVYLLGGVLRHDSLLDDIRFNPAAGTAYLTDAGYPGLIVLDLDTGEAVRVLDEQPSTSGFFPVSAEGYIPYIEGEPFFLYADQMEVSPDGKYFYYQPGSGGMSRIKTDLLNEALQKFANSTFHKTLYLNKYVEPYAFTPSTGGTAIDADGNIYSSDVDSQRIIKISPTGLKTLLVQDPRLLWIDAMWVDSTGKLWMPAAQLNRGYPFHHGVSQITKPLYIYSIDIGVGPSPIDHD